MSEASRSREKNIAVMASSADETVKFTSWALSKDGSWLPGAAPAPSQERIAIGTLASQATRLNTQPEISHAAVAPQVQAKSPDKTAKISHRQDQDDLIVTTPGGDELGLQNFDPYAQSSSPVLWSFNPPGDQAQVLVAQLESVSVGDASATSSAKLPIQDVNLTTGAQEEKDDDKFWLLTFWGGTLVGVLPLLVLSGGFSGGSPNAGVSNVSPPNAPSITSLTDDVGSITGVVASGGRSDDTQLVVRVSLTGTGAVANDSVQLYDNTSAIAGAVTLSATNITNGWVDISTNTLSNATSYAFNAKITDVAGNVGAASSNYTVTIDTTAPTAPSITSLTDDVGSITGVVASGGRSDDTQLVVRVSLTGTGAVANDSVQLFDNTSAIAGAVTLSATNITNGWVDISTNTLSNATSYAFNAKITDVAGNVGAASSNYTVTIDTTAPTAPSITSLTDDVGSITGVVASGGRSDDTQLVVRVSLTGTSAVANDSVQLYDNTSAIAGAVTLSATNITNGWVDISTNTLSNATTYAFNAKITDVAGNVGAASSNYTVTIDTTAPTAPSITSLTDDVGGITGVVASGGRSDDTQLVVRVSLTGTGAVANDSVQLYDNTSAIAGAVTLSATNITNGWVDISTNTLSNATTYAFNAKITDVAGNVGAASSNYTVTIDTTAPAFTSASAWSVVDTGSGVTNTTTLSTATATDASVVSYALVAPSVGDANLFNLNSTTGVLTFKSTEAYAASHDTGGDHVYNVTVSASDIAGNSSTQALTLTMTANAIYLQDMALGMGGFVINGASSGDVSGLSVSAAGDVNGDGLADVIIGAPNAWNGPANLAGRSYVVFGKTSTTAVDLSAVAAGTGGFVITGQSPQDTSGQSVSAAGDVNGDGLADVIVGADYSDPAAGGNAGRSYVVFGKTTTTAVDLGAVAGGAGGFVINGQCAGDRSGMSVSLAGDVNGDGLADLIVGAGLSDPAVGNDAGRSYVVFGKADTTSVDLSAVAAGVGGFVIKGQCASDLSGTKVSAAGDVNGDGFADVIVGAYQSDPAAGVDAGRSYVVFGKANTTAIDLSDVAAGVGGFVINGQSLGDNSGYAVSAAGDVNGDGLADLAVSAVSASTSAGALAGQSYVVFGKTSSTGIDLSAVAAGNGGFVIKGQCAGDNSGVSLSAAGDVNGDGLADMIVGAWLSDPSTGVDAGRTYVVYGKTNTSAMDLSAVAAGTGGFVVNGQCAGDNSGQSVSAAGDVNGDGLADLLVGASQSDPTSGVNAGRSYVIFGSTTGAFAQTAVDQVATSSHHTLTSSGNQTLVGSSGDDTLISSGTTGADVLYGGAGNDTFVVSAAMVTALQSTFGAGGNNTQLARIDGGTGIDVVQLASGTANAMANTVFDLTAVANAGANSSRLSSVEVVDLSTDASLSTGKGNQLTLGLSDVLDMTGMNIFNSGNTSSSSGAPLGASVSMHQLMVWGDATDYVTVNSGSWVKSLTQTALTYNGHTLVAFDSNLASVHAQLLIDQNIVNASGHLTFVKNPSDTPVLGPPAAIGLTDTTAVDTFSNVTGTLNASFVDTGTPLTFGITGGVSGAYTISAASYDLQKAGTYGTLYVNSSSGAYVFVANAGAVNAVAGASSPSESFTVSATDSNLTGTNTLSVTVTGADDPTVIKGVSTASLIETNAASSLSTTGQLTATDVDSSAAFVAQTGVAGSHGYGQFSIDAGGAWTYTANSAHDEFVGGQTYTDAFTVATADGTTQVITVTMAGTNDAAVVSGTVTGSMTENIYPNVSPSVRLTASDVDPPSSSFQAVTTNTLSNGGYGFYTMKNTLGQWKWTYTLDNSNASVQALNTGETLTDTFTVHTADGTPQTITITINGNSGYILLSNIAAGTGGFVINGQSSLDASGNSVSAAGDVNGDGLADVIVGAAYSNPASGTDAGRSYVVFGKTSTTGIDLSAVAAGTGGFVINGQGASDQSGISVSSAGDVNGDGLADLLVGAYKSDPAAGLDAGRSYVVFGKSSGTAIDLSAVAAGTGGFVINGQGAGDFSGFSVKAAGDVNGDGLADVMVGAYQSDPAGGVDAGRSYVVFGKASGSAIDLSDVAAGVGGFVINGLGAGAQSGFSVSAAGDVNGDGFADVIVGSPGTSPGTSYVVFGKASGSAIHVSDVAAGTGGFVINGQFAGDQSGYSVSAAGDVNGDGLADVVVGAIHASLGTVTQVGRSYVVFGQTSTAPIDLSAVAAGTGGFVINGQENNDRTGLSVSTAGDVNGDGLADVIVSSPYQATASAAGYNAGRSYVVFGKTSGGSIDLSAVAFGSGGFVIDGQGNGDFSGASVSAAGDVNGDGLADLLVGATGGDPTSSTDAGRSYVIFGSTTGAFAQTAVDQVATSSHHTLTSSGNQTLVGSSGDDTLISSGTTGADVLYGGAGNDTFVVSAAMVTALQSTFGAGGNNTQLARIDGGTGIDVVQLASGTASTLGGLVDLTAIRNVGGGASRLNSVEVVDLSVDASMNGAGTGNQLKLGLGDVLDMTGMNVFNGGNTSSSSGAPLGASVAMHQLMVWGDATDVVNIGLAYWTKSVTNTAITYSGHTLVAYNYTTAGVYAQLLIDQNIVNAGHVI